MVAVATERYLYRKEYVGVCDATFTIAQADDGTQYYPIRATCAALGVVAGSQIEGIKADSRFAGALRAVALPTAGGAQLTQCLPRREYVWWMATIEPGRVKESIRKSLIMRQRALWDLADRLMMATEREVASAIMASRPSGVIVPGEFHLNCLQCGAPHCLVLDNSGAHLYVANEPE